VEILVCMLPTLLALVLLLSRLVLTGIFLYNVWLNTNIDVRKGIFGILVDGIRMGG
jgi:hypothetical protein